MKSRMREIRTYGSVRGDRLPLTSEEREVVVVSSTRLKCMRNKTKKILIFLFNIITLLAFVLIFNQEVSNSLTSILRKNEISYSIDEIPLYSGDSYVVINDNQPNFNIDELSTSTFEIYSELDYLGRCGTAFANVSINTLPTTERGSIGMIKPSGWHTVKYDNISGKYLYNRCHLIGYQLAGENANKKNLITCTRQMNTMGMLQFENKVVDYVKNTKNHVYYRVTPIFKDNNLLASGVQLEALSVEDKGKGIKLNVFIYNVQDGIEIDYLTGESKKIN